MDSAYIWTIAVGLGVLTYLIRFSFLGLLAGRQVPPVVRRALSFVPVTVLPAMVAPMIAFETQGSWGEPHRILAALVTVAVGAATRNLVFAIFAGITSFWVLRSVGL